MKEQNRPRDVVLSNRRNRVRRIVHMSDIHIMNKDTRHEEYLYVIESLDTELKALKLNPKQDVVVITGDILDSASVNGYSTQMLVRFYNTLLKHSPVVSILGNHDTELGETALTLTDTIQGENRHFLLPTQGTYRFNNIIFGVTGLCSSEVCEIEKKKGFVYVSLHHGRITEEKNSDGLSLSDFEQKYDWCLFGDVHKTTFLSERSWYPGSLLQTKRTEGLEKGFVVLDLKKRNSRFVRVWNDFGMIRFTVSSNGESDYDQEKIYPYNLDISIVGECVDNKVMTDLEMQIREKYNVVKCSKFNSLEREFEYNVHQDDPDIFKKEDLKKAVLNRVCSSNCKKDYKERMSKRLNYLINRCDGRDENRFIDLCNMRIERFMNIPELDLDFTDPESVKNANIRYRSSLFDAVLFSVYGFSSRIRGGASRYDRISIIQEGESEYETCIELTVNLMKYRIHRKGTWNRDEDRVVEKCAVYRMNRRFDSEENENVIRKEICSPEEFMSMCWITDSSFLSGDQIQNRTNLLSTLGYSCVSDLARTAQSMKNREIDDDGDDQWISDFRLIEKACKDHSFINALVKNGKLGKFERLINISLNRLGRSEICVKLTDNRMIVKTSNNNRDVRYLREEEFRTVDVVYRLCLIMSSPIRFSTLFVKSSLKEKAEIRDFCAMSGKQIVFV